MPTQNGSSVTHCTQRMTDIELHITESAFTVFPRFTPCDAAETEQKLRLGSGLHQCTAQFQSVFVRRVVVHAVAQTVDTAGNDVTFGGVQIAAGRIATQCPTVRTVLFPRRQTHRQFEQCGNIPPHPQPFPRRFCQRQFHQRRTRKAAKRVGLLIPIEVLRPFSIGLQGMLSALVISVNRSRAGVVHRRVCSKVKPVMSISGV